MDNAETVESEKYRRMELASAWQEYRILDAGDGEKIERWGGVVLQIGRAHV